MILIDLGIYLIFRKPDGRPKAEGRLWRRRGSQEDAGAAEPGSASRCAWVLMNRGRPGQKGAGGPAEGAADLRSSSQVGGLFWTREG